jgi:transposase InsO family protein
MKFAFIAAHQPQYEVKIMSRVLQVSQSGYSAWRQRGVSQRAHKHARMVEAIRAIHTESRHSYGGRRVSAQLAKDGLACNHKRVARLMKMDGLAGKGRGKRRPPTTTSDPQRVPAPNLLNREFKASAPNQKWLADITYLETSAGFVYLAAVLDTFSRRIIGWALAEHLHTALVEDAMRMAIQRRQPHPPLVHHSDRGTQYTSEAYQALLAKHHLTVSMRRRGNCYDNAMLESFWGTLKAECASGPFASLAAARLASFEYLEVWYNRCRLHSSLNYTNPAQFELQYALSDR